MSGRLCGQPQKRRPLELGMMTDEGSTLYAWR
jgi:hypothetical protein